MANEFKIKKGFLIGDQLDGESLPVSGIVNDVSTATATDIVTGDGIKSYVDTEINTVSGYVDSILTDFASPHNPSTL